MGGTIFVSVFLFLAVIRLTKILSMSPESLPPTGDEILTIVVTFIHTAVISAFVFIVHQVLSLF